MLLKENDRARAPAGPHAAHAMDGVTTAMELESEVGPVAQFYAEREAKARVNYGGGGGRSGVPDCDRPAARQLP